MGLALRKVAHFVIRPRCFITTSQLHDEPGTETQGKATRLSEEKEVRTSNSLNVYEANIHTRQGMGPDSEAHRQIHTLLPVRKKAIAVLGDHSHSLGHDISYAEMSPWPLQTVHLTAIWNAAYAIYTLQQANMSRVFIQAVTTGRSVRDRPVCCLEEEALR
jgi:hypothetical protein